MEFLGEFEGFDPGVEVLVVVSESVKRLYVFWLYMGKIIKGSLSVYYMPRGGSH